MSEKFIRADFVENNLRIKKHLAWLLYVSPTRIFFKFTSDHIEALNRAAQVIIAPKHEISFGTNLILFEENFGKNLHRYFCDFHEFLIFRGGKFRIWDFKVVSR